MHELILARRGLEPIVRRMLVKPVTDVSDSSKASTASKKEQIYYSVKLGSSKAT